MDKKNAIAHRAACLKIVICLLTVWFTVSFGCGILFREQLDAFKIGNAPFGFWMAQQGSIICFVLILVVYAYLMNQLDKKYDFHEEDEVADSAKVNHEQEDLLED